MIKHTDTCECGREMPAFQLKCHLCLRVELTLRTVFQMFDVPYEVSFITRKAILPRKLDG